jgi:hypothetical protein
MMGIATSQHAGLVSDIVVVAGVGAEPTERDFVFAAISRNANQGVEDAWRGSVAESGICWRVGPPAHDDAAGRSHLEIGWAFQGEWRRIRGEKNQTDEGQQGRHFDPPDGIADPVRSSRRDHRGHHERSVASLDPVQSQSKPLTLRSSTNLRIGTSNSFARLQEKWRVHANRGFEPRRACSPSTQIEGARNGVNMLCSRLDCRETLIR